MLSICIVIASIAAAAYLIFKKYYAPGALLFVGLITLGVVACISPDPLITGKKATHSHRKFRNRLFSAGRRALLQVRLGLSSTCLK